MNHCPVYGAIGGHAYGWVYPGPIGAVLTPQLIGVEEAGNLPNASTFCGRCESVCPVRIPLPSLMRHWREREFERHLTPRAVRQGLALWSFVARRPQALSPPDRARQPRARRCSAAPTAATAPCRWPSAGRASATSRRRSRRHLPCPMGAARRQHERAMSEARSQILDGIRRSLQRGELAGGRAQAVEARLAAPPRGPRSRARQPPAAREGGAVLPMGRGQQRHGGAGRAPAEVPGEVAAYLARNNLPAAGRDGALARSSTATTGRARRCWRCGAAAARAATMSRSPAPSPASPRPARW